MKLVCVISPEEHELAELTLRIAWQSNQIDSLEAELRPLQRAFETFEWIYTQRIGRLAAELRELRATVQQMEQSTTKIHARLVSDPDGALGNLFNRDELLEIGEMFGIDVPDEWFDQAHPGHGAGEPDWEWAEESAAEEEILRRLHLEQRRRLPEDIARELKTRYRELARRFHPDLAQNEEERSFRQEVMLRINHAWQCQDIAALRSIDQEMEAILPGWSAGHLAHRLAWARREHERLTLQSRTLVRRIRQLRTSKTFPLWFNPALGQSTIASRAAALEKDIALEQDRLAEARVAFQQALAHYASSIA